ncbi:MAG: outer membrane lipoprotein carrier protein LolA [Gemmatimonadales bacterium]
MLALLWAAALAGGAGPTVQIPPDSAAAAIATRAAEVYRGLTSFQADFTQLIEDSMLGDLASRGRLIQSGTARLSMQFADPKGDALVMDGQWLWAYTPSTTPGQVIRMPLPSGPTFGPNVLAWLLDDPVRRYRISSAGAETVDGTATDMIALAPIDPSLPFVQAILWIGRDDGLPHRVQVKEKSGARRTLSFTRLRPNAPVSAATFRFTVPSGVRVVER